MFHRVKLALCDVTLRMLMYCLTRTHHVNSAVYVMSQHKHSCLVLHTIVNGLNGLLIKYIVRSV